MNKTYSRINWENYPSEKTPLNEVYLNRIDYSVNEIDNRVISLDTAKLDKTTANGLVKGVAYNNANGVFTVTYLNGSTAAIDTKMEKLAVNFSYDAADQRLVITLDDGTKQYVELDSLITEYEFSNSNTISFTVENGKVKANVNRGAITGDMLQPDYLADITVQAKKAEKGAADSALSAEESETAARRAEKAAEDAESIAGVGIATTEKAGIIKGNADEFLVAGDGKLSLTSSYAVQNTLTEITGTENKKTLFGKIAKGVKELMSHIGNDSIHNVLTNNLLTTVAGTALDAVQGKALDNKITEVNRKLQDLRIDSYSVAIQAGIDGGEAVLTFNDTTIDTSSNQRYVIQLTTAGTSNVQFRRYLLSANNTLSLLDDISTPLCTPTLRIDSYNHLKLSLSGTPAARYVVAVSIQWFR